LDACRASLTEPGRDCGGGRWGRPGERSPPSCKRCRARTAAALHARPVGRVKRCNEHGISPQPGVRQVDGAWRGNEPGNLPGPTGAKVLWSASRSQQSCCCPGALMTGGPGARTSLGSPCAVPVQFSLGSASGPARSGLTMNALTSVPRRAGKPVGRSPGGRQCRVGMNWGSVELQRGALCAGLQLDVLASYGQQDDV